MKKSLRIKVREGCSGDNWSPGVFHNKKQLGRYPYKSKKAAIRRAKFLAKITGIPYDPEIIKQRGC